MVDAYEREQQALHDQHMRERAEIAQLRAALDNEWANAEDLRQNCSRMSALWVAETRQNERLRAALEWFANMHKAGMLNQEAAQIVYERAFRCGGDDDKGWKSAARKRFVQRVDKRKLEAPVLADFLRERLPMYFDFGKYAAAFTWNPEAFAEELAKWLGDEPADGQGAKR